MSTLRIFLGSENDRPYLTEGLAYLNERNVAYAVQVASVHRGPNQAHETLTRALSDPDVRVIIGCAASATGLPGVIAGYVQECQRGVVVFGVRIEKNPGARIVEDASFALSSMPRGVPLAYTGFNNTGFLHACMLATKILNAP